MPFHNYTMESTCLITPYEQHMYDWMLDAFKAFAEGYIEDGIPLQLKQIQRKYSLNPSQYNHFYKLKYWDLVKIVPIQYTDNKGKKHEKMCYILTPVGITFYQGNSSILDPIGIWSREALGEVIPYSHEVWKKAYFPSRNGRGVCSKYISDSFSRSKKTRPVYGQEKDDAIGWNGPQAFLT